MSDFEAWRGELRAFVAERDWGRFHDPKSLALALTGEVGELCELLQWLPADQVGVLVGEEPLRGRLAEEMADVLAYLACLADAAGIDLVEAATSKLIANEGRFPAADHLGVAPTKA